jgi:hypothetical protein
MDDPEMGRPFLVLVFLPDFYLIFAHFWFILKEKDPFLYFFILLKLAFLNNHLLP